MRWIRIRRLVLSLALLAVPAVSQSHDRGGLRGRVTDETGAVLPKVTLLLHSVATGRQYSTTSGETGDFLFPLLAIGPYTLTAALPGFSGLKMEGLRVVSDHRLDLPLMLKHLQDKAPPSWPLRQEPARLRATERETSRRS